MDIRAKILAAFQVEYKDHLEFIRSTLNKLDSGEEECGQKLLDEMFRRAHSLKGASRAADLKAVETLSHRMETLFSHLRSQDMRLDDKVSKVLHDASDAIEDCVVASGKGETPDPASALEAMDKLLSTVGGEEETCEEDAPKAEAAIPLTKAPPPDTEEAAPVTKTAPTAPAVTVPAEADSSIRVSAANLDRLLRSAGQLMTENVGQEVVKRKLRSIERSLDDVERLWNLLGGISSPIRQGGAVDRHLDRMDEYIRLLSKETRAARHLHQRSAFMLRQLGDELQDEIRLARMVPAESVFGGFRKMVRDLARDEDKEIEVRVTGLDVKADRLVLQALKDPVMHMVRNAVFHGIEKRSERAGKKKDRTARLTLRFEVEGGRLSIEIDDDGRGIDFKKVAENGIRDGFLGKDKAATTSTRELLDIIVKPGFSTAKKVTDLAGRGMGLSVVQEAAARLNGSFEIIDKATPGTTFHLLVPLSISTHRLLMVVSQNQTFAVPTDGIERLCRVNLKDVKTVEGTPVINIQDRQLPLQSLAKLLGLGTEEVSVQEGVMPVMILNSGQTRVAVAVDSLLVIRDAVIKDLGFPLPRGSKVAGGILLEDGSISTVLSPFSLAEAFRLTGAAKKLVTEERAPEVKPPTILVVDDSITTRTLEKSILEAHGYRVLIAVDGLEALTELHSQPIDLVVSDVQMPRLDGFGLLREIKKDPSIANIPVIMVTSMESKSDQELGLSLGADAYVVKQKFDQQDLLDTIAQIL